MNYSYGSPKKNLVVLILLIFSLKRWLLQKNHLTKINSNLLIILIIIITSTILIKSFSKDKQTTLNYNNQEQVSYKKNYYQKFIWIADINYLKNF